MKSSQGIKKCVAAGVVVAMGVLSAATAGAESLAVARKHAAKANQLAAKNKCKAAVPWFNRAYRVLKDPALLFNRAECLRRLGETNDALQDYELFLVDMPQAPNRATVEARIASLRAALKAAAMAGSAQGAHQEAAPSGPPKEPALTELPAVKSPSIEAARRAEQSTNPARAGEGKAPVPANPAKEAAAAVPSKKPPAVAAPTKDSEANPAPGGAKRAEKSAEEPAHRAEKWGD